MPEKTAIFTLERALADRLTITTDAAVDLEAALAEAEAFTGAAAEAAEAVQPAAGKTSGRGCRGGEARPAGGRAGARKTRSLERPGRRAGAGPPV